MVLAMDCDGEPSKEPLLICDRHKLEIFNLSIAVNGQPGAWVILQPVEARGKWLQGVILGYRTFAMRICPSELSTLRYQRPYGKVSRKESSVIIHLDT